MFFSWLMTIEAPEAHPDDRAVKAHDDEGVRERLLRDFQPFVIRYLSDLLGRFIEVENDEAYPIALEAFNEAIDRYEKTRGSFLTFAKMVIKSRVFDELRKQTVDTVPDAVLVNESGREDVAYSTQVNVELTKYRQILSEHGMGFEDLVRSTPVQYPTRQRAVMIAKEVASNIVLTKALLEKRRLPIKATAKVTGTTVKIVKGSKVFIYALALAYINELETLVEYLDEMERGG